MLADRVRRTREWVGARGNATLRFSRGAVEVIAGALAELLLVAALLGGWASLTVGVAAIPGARARIVWPISIGLLLLSGCGWGFLARIAIVGIYARTRKSKA